MAVPDGVDAEPGSACQLLKSLYGLKQSPRCWNERFNQVLIQLGFTRSRYDYCLYSRFNERGSDAVFLVLYVDDLLIIGKRQETIQNLKLELARTFEMTDCGEVNFFLGMKIDYDWQRGRMKLSQAAGIDKVLKKFGMDNCNPTRTPMEKGLVLGRQATEASQEPYRELLGSLMYVMMSTRPDICYSVGYLGRFQQQPGQQHWTALKRVVRYLKGTKQMGLDFNRSEGANCLIGFADADWATDTEDRKSVSGFLFQVYGNTVSWSSKKQTTVATSSSEAEYVALSAAASEAIWLTGLLGDLGEVVTGPVTIFEDNHGCIGMAKNLESKRAKHIDIKHHFIRDHIADGKLDVQPIGTANQLADIFTKSLDPGQFGYLRGQLGLRDREGV